MDSFSGTGPNVTWLAPATPGTYTLRCQVDDGGVVPAGDAGDRNDAPVAAQELMVVVQGAPRPDLAIRNLDDLDFIGNDIYNNDGTNQTKTQTKAPGQVATYYVLVQNDRTAANDSFKITGPGDSGGWLVRYYVNTGNVDITSSVIGGGWSTPTLASGATLLLRVTAVCGATAVAQKDVPVTAISTTINSYSDTIKIIALKGGPRPDAHIRNLNDATYLGDNVFNTSGSGQDKAQTVEPGVTATYYVLVQNDGDAADTFKVTGPGDAGGWLLRYYDNATNADLTASVVGSGWSTPSLAPAASLVLRVTVRAGGNVLDGTVNNTLLTVAAVSDAANKVDAVKASTTCRNVVEATFISGLVGPYGSDNTAKLRAAAGAISGDNVHSTTTTIQLKRNGQPLSSGIVTLSFDGVDYAGMTPPKLINASGTAVTTLTVASDTAGQVNVTVLSSNLISQPRLVVKWNGVEVGSAKCDFDSVFTYRNFANHFNPEEVEDTGWLFDFPRLTLPGQSTPAKVYLKHMIAPNAGNIWGNWKYVNQHNALIKVLQVKLHDGTVITGTPDQLKDYASIVDPADAIALTRIVTTGAVPNASGVYDGAAQVTVKAGPKIKEAAMILVGAEELTQHSP